MIRAMTMPVEKLVPADARKAASTVSELTKRIKALLEGEIGFVYVWGEASNVRYQSTGHLYFDLKDEESKIFVAVFRGLASTLRFRVEDGMELLVAGRVTVYGPRGNYQIVAAKVEPKGVGALQIAFDQLKSKLEKEGLFAPERKKPLPAFPRKIAIVTSPTGAALRDMLNVLEQRFPPLHITIYPARVQGAGAAEEIAEAIGQINLHVDADVIIAGRGGGSIEDLWSFNEEVVARAIAASRIPVISAVGHETDVTISDLVADFRALTPTHAAEIVTPFPYGELIDALRGHGSRLDADIEKRLALLEETLGRFRDGYALRSPAVLADRRGQYLDEMTVRLRAGLQQRLHEAEGATEQYSRALTERFRERIARVENILTAYGERLTLRPIDVNARHYHEGLRRLSSQMGNLLQGAVERSDGELRRLAALLESLSPLQVLSRGYTITFDDASGQVVTDATRIETGALLRTKYKNGETLSRVERVERKERPSGVAPK